MPARERSASPSNGVRRPRVVISNVFADDNRGGAAITAATIETVLTAAPEAELTLISTRGDEARATAALRHTAERYPGARILPAPFTDAGAARTAWALVRSLATLVAPRRGRDPALTAIREADLVVSKGGHVFVERGGPRGVLGLWFTSFPLVHAARLRIPSVAFAASIGPFDTATSARVCRAVLRRTSAVLPRDPRSAAVARDLVRASTRVLEVPDSVFSMAPPTATDVARMVERFGLQGLRYGVFTVRAYGTDEERLRVFRSLAEAAVTLLDDGRLDRVLAVVQADGLQVSDLDESRTFVELADDERVHLFVEDLSPRELIALYGGAGALVGCRMHSTIFATVAGTPSIGVALVGDKVAGVFEQLGFPERVVHQNAIDASDLVARVATLLDDPDERRRTQEAARVARAGTRRSADLLRSLLQERGAERTGTALVEDRS